MAGFRTHIGTSTVLGIGYGAAGLVWLPHPDGQLPVASCLLGAGLCSIAGMLPDLDSDSGVPIREMTALSAAVVPMLMMHRFSRLGLSHESMVLCGGLIYLLVRFGIGKLLKRFTVHRGMFHSLPAAGIAGTLAFLICSGPDLTERYFLAGAVVLGFMSHLVLDEIWSLEWHVTGPRVKKSFGTALKFWGDGTMANLFTYGLLALLLGIATQDPAWMGKIEDQIKQGRKVPTIAVEAVQRLWR